jgi:hypothetical protein
VACEVAAMPKAVTGHGGMKRDGPPTFDEGLHSPGDGGKPPKAPRLA